MIYKIMLSDDLRNAFNIEDKYYIYESCLDDEDTLDQVREYFYDQIQGKKELSEQQMLIIYNGITIQGKR